MKVEKKLEDGKVKLTVTIEKTELKKVEDAVYADLSKNIRVPGFRPGKAPRYLIEKEIGRERLNAEVLERIIPDTYAKAIIDEKVDVAGAPEVKVVKFVPTDGLTYEALVELVPEVILPDLKKIKVKRETIEVTPKEVDDIKLDLLKKMSSTAKVDRPAKSGDRVDIDFEGFIDNLPFEGGKGDNYPLVIGDGNFIPGFEEQIIGMRSGEEKEIKVTFPKDYHAAKYADKKATFKVKVNILEEIIMPELTDELAAKIGPFETTKELEADIKEQLMVTKKIQERNRVENEIFEKLLAETTIKPPYSLVHQEIHRLLHEAEHNLADSGLSMERYLAMTKKSEDDLEKELEPEAEKRVKIGLILTQISKEIKPQVTERDIEAEAERRVSTLSGDEKKKGKEYYRSLEGKRQIENSLIGEKVINYLFESCSK